MGIRHKVVVWCPACPTRMEFYRADLAAIYQISCPGCGQKNTVHPASETVISTGPSAANCGDLPGDPIALPDSIPPFSDGSDSQSKRSGNAASFSFAKRRSKAKRSVPGLALCLAGIAGLLTIFFGGAIFLVRSGSMPHGSLFATTIVDTPQAVVNDFFSASDAISGAMRSVGGKTPEVVISDLESSRQRCDEIASRAAAIGPLSEAEASTVATILSKRSHSAKTVLQDSIDQARQTGRYQGRLRAIGDSALMSLDKIQGVLARAWEPIPEPGNATQKVGYQVLLVQRRVWLACAHPDDDLAKANVIREATAELEMLLEQNRSLLQERPIHRLGSPYFGRKFTDSRDLYAMVGPGDAQSALADYVRINQSVVSPPK